MTELIQVSWPSSEEDDRVDPGVEVRHVGHDTPQKRMTELIQVLKCATLVMTPGWLRLAQPMPHEMMPANSHLPVGDSTDIGPPESPCDKKKY
jgi:hypothetical protein